MKRSNSHKCFAARDHTGHWYGRVSPPEKEKPSQSKRKGRKLPMLAGKRKTKKYNNENRKAYKNPKYRDFITWSGIH